MSPCPELQQKWASREPQAHSNVSLAKMPGFGMRNITQERFLEGQIPQVVCTLGSLISVLAAAMLELRRDTRETAGSLLSAQNEDDSANNNGLLASTSRPDAGTDVERRRTPRPPPDNAVALGGRAQAPPSAWKMYAIAQVCGHKKGDGCLVCFT